jgi:predicted O-methyltransferase YrrM
MNRETPAAIAQYIKHLFKSFHLHGIHSPFVFQFEKKCLRDVLYYEDYEKLSRFRESVKKSPSVLHVEDHGAGSKVFKSNTRNTADILKHNSSSMKTSKMLYRVAQYFKPRRVLELGTSLGIATHAIATAMPGARIETVEGSAAIADFTRENFKDHQTNNVQVITSTFNDFLDHGLSTSPSISYDLIYLDGHHDGAATIAYFEKLLPYAHKDSVFILDDIYWSRDMTAAWNTLCKHPKVTASVDIFELGFLFLRKEQSQQRFHVFC